MTKLVVFVGGPDCPASLLGVLSLGEVECPASSGSPSLDVLGGENPDFDGRGEPATPSEKGWNIFPLDFGRRSLLRTFAGVFSSIVGRTGRRKPKERNPNRTKEAERKVEYSDNLKWVYKSCYWLEKKSSSRTLPRRNFFLFRFGRGGARVCQLLSFVFFWVFQTNKKTIIIRPIGDLWP